MRSFSTTLIASSLCMLRRRTPPAERAALTMTLTTGFCMAERLVGEEGVLSRSGQRRKRANPARGPGREVYHCRMSDPSNSEPAGDDTAPNPSASQLQAANLRIVLVGTQHPGNIGSAARAMKTMGLANLVLVAPEKAPDRDTHAMAAGADDLVEAAPVF